VPEDGLSGKYGRLFLSSIVGDKIAGEVLSRAHAGAVDWWKHFEEAGNSQRGATEA
jgi:hypothetical protein